MPRAESSTSKSVSVFASPRQPPKWIWASLCFLLATLLIVAFIDYAPNQNWRNTTEPRENLVGWFGSEVSWHAFTGLGSSAFLLPLFLFWVAYLLVRNVRRHLPRRSIAMVCCLAAVSGLAAMQGTLFVQPEGVYTHGPGGYLGRLIYEAALRDSFGAFGSALLLGTTAAVGLLFIFIRDMGAEFDRLFINVQAWWKGRSQRKAERRAKKAEMQRLKKEAKAKAKAEKKAAAAAARSSEPRSAPPPAAPKFTLPKPREDPLKLAAQILDAPPPPPAAPPPQAKPEKAMVIRSTAPSAAPKPPVDPPGSLPKQSLKIIAPESPRKAAIKLPERSGNYIFPPANLLKPPVRPNAASNEEEHRNNMDTLIRTLGEFGVAVNEGEVHTGPVITRYEILPAAGVRVEKISGLDKNLALALRAQSVRILAPVPGKGCVGVEVPNQNPTPVGLREILESEAWINANAELPIVLGKDVSGTSLISDLTRMPHLLIAGATGSGKSVCINSIIASILYHASPDDVRLLMVDPKIVELKIFNSLPHMLIPVVTEPKKVPGALKWLLAEMERRYQIFARVGVRNINGFNNRKIELPPEEPPEAEEAQESLPLPGAGDDGLEIPDGTLPYIVAIIDELADLMMVAPAEIETSIARLAQLARAAGIHLVIATQRPSVNVITGVIKANLPSRIAFQVASQVDARTILDTKGAETLIGRGDMLFSPPGTSRLIRAQGAFVSDEEISGIVEFLKRNGPPQYAREVQEQIDRDPDGDPGDDSPAGEDDEMLPQAIDVLRATKRASTSMLQRRLRIGYNRAARLMEILEDRGIVGPENGAQPREILVDLDSL